MEYLSSWVAIAPRLIRAHPRAHPRGCPAPPEGPPPRPTRGKPGARWAQAGPKPGLSWAKAGPKPDFWKFENVEPGNLEIWDPKKSQNMQILKIEIHVVQNVGKVWINRRNNLPAPFWAIPGNFLCGPEKCKTTSFFAYVCHGVLELLGGHCSKTHEYTLAV